MHGASRHMCCARLTIHPCVACPLQVGLQLSGNGRTATLLYGYSVSPGVTLGLEAVSDVTMPTRGISGGAGAAAGGVPVEAAAAEGGTAAASKATGSGFRLSPPVTALGASFRLPAKVCSVQKDMHEVQGLDVIRRQVLARPVHTEGPSDGGFASFCPPSLAPLRY